ncbi:MAG TPA: ATP-binding protein [Anaerolineae bacterium]|nr:ATP-binding protein [Anaerolineae bacterium]
MPAWFEEFRAVYGAGEAHAFILYLNVADYAVPGVPLRTFLTKTLASRDVIAIYNRAEGITFPLPTMQQKAMEILGLDPSTTLRTGPSTGSGQALAALASLSGAQPQGAELPRSPSGALPLLERLLKADVRTAVLIEYADSLAPAADMATMSPDDRTALVTLQRWGRDPQMMSSGNMVILVTANLADIHPALRAASSRYKAIEIPLPDRQARQDYITWYLARKPDASALAMSPEELANATAGLSLIHLEDIFLRAELEGALTWELVQEQKAAIIETEYAGLLEMIEPAFGFEAVGGMEPLKEWARGEIIHPVRQGDFQDVPKGVLLVGPPGTGKSFFVKALAREIGFNAVALNLENILGGIVGTSERNLARALSVVRSLSPVLLFIDELDQSDVSSRGNTSGNPVAKNLFNQMLRFLGDESNRGRTIFFGASNRPDLVDPALLRFGRVDAVIPVLLPDEAERRAIVLAQARSQEISIAPEAVERIAGETEKYSAADLAAVVTKARKLARRAGRREITTDEARRALSSIRPATLKNADFFTLLAVDAVNDTDLLPPQYARMLENRQALSERILALSDVEGKEVQPATRGRREL